MKFLSTFFFFLLFSQAAFSTKFNLQECRGIDLNHYSSTDGQGYNVYVSGPRSTTETSSHENALIVRLKNSKNQYHCKFDDTTIQYAVLPVDSPEFDSILSIVLSAKAMNRPLRLMLNKDSLSGATREIVWANF